MSSAGFQLVAGRIPGERIATEVLTSASSTFTAETQIHTVTAALVSGRTYSVTMITGILSTVAGDNVDTRIREDNTSGTILQQVRKDLLATNITECIVLYAEYTAVATGNKTFVGTAARQAGTGNLSRNSGVNTPSYLFVEYVSG